MKQCSFFLTLGAISCFSSLAHAKAIYKSKSEMIRSADAIAIINITAIEAAETKGTHYTYRQKATATVEQIVRGSLPRTAFLYGLEQFRCARCRFAPGRYLVFLDRDGARLIGNNWHLSTCKISGDARRKFVEWPQIDQSQPPLKQPLQNALNEIRLSAQITKK